MMSCASKGGGAGRFRLHAGRRRENVQREGTHHGEELSDGDGLYGGVAVPHCEQRSGRRVLLGQPGIDVGVGRRVEADIPALDQLHRPDRRPGLVPNAEDNHACAADGGRRGGIGTQAQMSTTVSGRPTVLLMFTHAVNVTQYCVLIV